MKARGRSRGAAGWFVLGLVLVATACRGGGGHDPIVSESLLAGDVALPSGHAFTQILEVEPNDDPETAQSVGVLDLDTWRAIAGAVDPEQGDRDAFRFTVPEPLRVQLSLQFTTSDAIDLDIEIYGVTTGEVPHLLAAGTSDSKSEEYGGYSIETPGDYEFYDFLVRPRSGTGFTRYIFNLATRTIPPAPQGEDLGGSGAEISNYADLDRISMSDSELIVSFAPSVHELDRLAFEARWGLRERAHLAGRARLYDVPWLREHGISGARAALVGVLAGVRQEGIVRAAQPNYIYRPDKLSDDPRATAQWHLDALRLPGTWDMTTGTKDVVVALVDSGVRLDHPDLDGLFTASGFDFILDEFMANDGDGLDDDPTDPGDGMGGLPSTFHGTHVAGLLGATTNNALGVAGCAWKMRVMPLRALGRGGGTTFDLANSVLYAVGLENSSGRILDKADRAAIINMSLGTTSSDPVLRDAIRSATDRGALVVAAAGNEHVATPHYPAAYDTTIAVAAVTRNLTAADYSNLGSWIDITAPGGELDPSIEDGILSTFWDEGSNRPSYAYFQGTSMAAPQVSAAALLVKAVAPQANRDELRDLLLETARDLGEPGRDPFYGEGLVDPFAAVEAAGGNPSGPPTLHLSTRKLTFDAEETKGTVLLTNSGTGVVDGLTAGVTLIDGDGWLGVELSATETPARLTATVRRGALDNGTYRATVDLTWTGGSQTVDVTMIVATFDPATTGNLVVLVMNTKTGKTVSQYIAGPDTGFAYRFKGLAAGRYYILAGTDEDGDLGLGDEGELFGVYPQLVAPLVIDVAGAARFEELDFGLDELDLGVDLPAIR